MLFKPLEQSSNFRAIGNGRYNLVKNTDAKVIYFTELLAEALGVKEKALEIIAKETLK